MLRSQLPHPGITEGIEKKTDSIFKHQSLGDGIVADLIREISCHSENDENQKRRQPEGKKLFLYIAADHQQIHHTHHDTE